MGCWLHFCAPAIKDRPRKAKTSSLVKGLYPLNQRTAKFRGWSWQYLSYFWSVYLMTRSKISSRCVNLRASNGGWKWVSTTCVGPILLVSTIFIARGQPRRLPIIFFHFTEGSFVAKWFSGSSGTLVSSSSSMSDSESSTSYVSVTPESSSGIIGWCESISATEQSLSDNSPLHPQLQQPLSILQLALLLIFYVPLLYS